MSLRFGRRTLTAICVPLAIFLGIMAVMPYRWARRVAAADVQREREHLATSAALFVTHFNRNIAAVVGYLGDDVQTAVVDRGPVSAPPRIVKGLYLVDEAGALVHVERLDAVGSFSAVATPEWIQPGACMNLISEHPLVITSSMPGSAAGHRRCLYALLDESYMRGTLVPQILREAFGESSMEDYDFAIVSRWGQQERVYGPKIVPELRWTFFTIPPGTAGSGRMVREDGHGLNERMSGWKQSQALTGVRGAPPPLKEVWELEIAHHGEPFATALRHKRQRELLIGLTAELLFGAAVVLLLIAAHRVQQTAEERMRFVAAVSHELRTPVSSISMLSRNQADGLLQGEGMVLQYGELIHQQSRRLSDMIEQVLQYAGIHSNLGSKTRESVDVKAVIADAVAERKEELESEGFQVDVDVPDEVLRPGEASIGRNEPPWRANSHANVNPVGPAPTISTVNPFPFVCSFVIPAQPHMKRDIAPILFKSPMRICMRRG
jgi:hypothetical protein